MWDQLVDICLPFIMCYVYSSVVVIAPFPMDLLDLSQSQLSIMDGLSCILSRSVNTPHDSWVNVKPQSQLSAYPWPTTNEWVILTSVEAIEPCRMDLFVTLGWDQLAHVEWTILTPPNPLCTACSH